MGQRQLVVAQTLFDEAEEALAGVIDARRLYVDLSDYAVGDDFTGAGTQTTCPSAYGYSFAGGSTEDGGGHFLFSEGMTEQSVWRDWLIRLIIGAPKWTEPVKTCQRPKAILLETGTGSPPLQSQIRSITVARIGQLVLLALPAEVTTMAGRRLRDTVMRELGDWAEHIVLVGYANGYAGYITTPEEYGLQQYEGGHTLHGRWTLARVSADRQSIGTSAGVRRCRRKRIALRRLARTVRGPCLTRKRDEAATRWRGAGRCSDSNGRSVRSGRHGDCAILVGESYGQFPQEGQLPFG